MSSIHQMYKAFKIYYDSEISVFDRRMCRVRSNAIASGVFRKYQGGNSIRARLVTLRAPGRKGVTGNQCAAMRLQKKSDGVLADGTR